MLSGVILRIIYADCSNEARYAKCYYAECYYYPGHFYAKCHKAKRSYAKFCSVKSHSLCSVLLVNQAHCVESIKMIAVMLSDIMPTILIFIILSAIIVSIVYYECNNEAHSAE